MPEKIFGQCEGCNSENVEIREFEHSPLKRKLCKLCANTVTGSMAFYCGPDEYNTRTILASINVVGNEIIRKITGKSPEF